MSNSTVAFKGWSSSLTSWNEGTWNGEQSITTVGTTSIGTSAGNVGISVVLSGFGTTASLGSYQTTNTSSQLAGSIGSATVTGDANVTVTGFGVTASLGVVFETLNGFSTTSSLGDIQTTNVGFSTTSSVGSVTTTSSAEVSVTGVTATGSIGQVLVWGAIIPSQNPSYSTITPSQSPSWTDIAAI